MALADHEFEGQMRRPSMVIWLVGATVLLFIVWAKFAWVDEIVRSSGEVVSASRPQIIQNFEGGILGELLVSEGDTVDDGQILARLQGTQYVAQVNDLQEQINAANIRRLRLEAEMAGLFDFDIPDEIAAASPAMVASEKQLLAARQADYASKVDGAQRIMSESKRELDQMEDMLAREIVSLSETTRARKAYADAEIKYNEIVTGAELARANENSEVLAGLSQLRQQLAYATDQLDRTIIRAPMRGVVNNLGVTTIGGTIRAGEEIFQIIPLDDALFVEAHVKPQDIANVTTGQTATVKLSAYDYTIYGSLSGVVQNISADTFKDERRADADPYYRVSVRVDMEDLGVRQQKIEMRPGLQANVELHTGEKTILHYLTKPLYRSQEALHEK
ncbi:HlyD family efflux transporter periplasmic adaptor subunit [Loktanella salsilacus]|jgi:adhesin transport system membrane fusion protein|uniref:HlyD family efflux transporter periplasmic adaptor subunit n=1 Tax=Loktanella salsilacus TaxID=195913 RepID=UPI0020B65AF9|nr:HlyD family efflux transporter periplasmic adaptor subunit [Loktanella salsilacus]MBU1835624.1 HlyD family efflux transporter periplasmic adaptor subunit [Alphaproteobacteria bacterium]UTH43318.1 HlyD family efflux transporter periplasmic adaptor subunit [Loktanella salsilacus]